MPDKQRQNAKMKRYRNQTHKHRLELMIRPELKDRFCALPGLAEATHAQRLAALCTLWEQHHPAVPLPAEWQEVDDIENLDENDEHQVEQSPANSPTPLAPTEPIDPDFLDSALQQLDAFDAQLLADAAADLADPIPEPEKAPKAPHSSWLDIPLPTVPPFPAKGYYKGIMTALQRLYDSEWPRRKHGNTEDSKRWKEALKSDPALLQAFRYLTFGKDQLAKLIRHCCLGINPREILAWAQLDENDRSVLLWYLVHAGTIYPEALGDVGQRFTQALEHQPKRNPFTWALEK